jgi:hypothetical protein
VRQRGEIRVCRLGADTAEEPLCSSRSDSPSVQASGGPWSPSGPTGQPGRGNPRGPMGGAEAAESNSKACTTKTYFIQNAGFLSLIVFKV